MVDDPYKVLGVSRDATKDEIKRRTGKRPRSITRTFIRMILRRLKR